MSQQLDARSFPLHGTRLIEASAGTGKTWTIAALYLRLVLGHGGEQAFPRPLLPADILVMTFTRAATKELSNRIRERLLEAAAYFRGQPARADDYLDALLAAYPDDTARQRAAYRLVLAAETMDEAAIFTIDAWCQRMLREHAFDSGSLFDETLVTDERRLFEDAAHDYWRQQVYPLNPRALELLQECWADVGQLKAGVRELVQRKHLLPGVAQEPLGALIAREQGALEAQLALLKQGWRERLQCMADWFAAEREAHPKGFSGTRLKPASLDKWLQRLNEWAMRPSQVDTGLKPAEWRKLTPAGLSDCCNKGYTPALPAVFGEVEPLFEALGKLAPLAHALHYHAAGAIARRMEELKRRSREYGFADMLERLRGVLLGENGEALRKRITEQFPVAMVDEFQDTSPEQYQIFDLLYRTQDNNPELGLFLIGDPKQSIYGFRGADIHSYLRARAATEGRHYKLGTNYRSTAALVEAVNRVFLHAEGPGCARGAFRFRTADSDRLPFDAVGAAGRKEKLVGVDGPLQALTVGCSVADMKADELRAYFAHHCAEHIVRLLNDERAGFEGPDGFRRLQPADIAVLVRGRTEARFIRRALAQRRVQSVYLSDKNSVLDSDEARDLLRWLAALANPLDGELARAAFATRTAQLPLAELARLAQDELAWEQRVEQLKELHIVWQRQGVLAMLRRFIHELGLPSMLLGQPGGERSLTNLLHLAELLQTASRQLDGEQALIRWLAEQMEDGSEQGDERVLRLESDAELVKVITVHKSKGLEYPLVYLPYAATARKVKPGGFMEYAGQDGERRIDPFGSAEAQAAAEEARLAEDLRLLYVALTRPRHLLWLGVAGKGLSDSALGYLLSGGSPDAALDGEQLLEHWERVRGGCDTIAARLLEEADTVTMLTRQDEQPELLPTRPYQGRFERDWSVGSFTSLARRSSAVGAQPVPVPRHALEEKLLEQGAGALAAPAQRTGDAPWHRFPRGSVPGNFLHEQLEWMGQEGFGCVRDPGFDARLARRIERAGWANRGEDATAWLHAIAETVLPPLGVALADLDGGLPEMEFWFPSERLSSGALDRLCRVHLLDGTPRPLLPERQLHGMLKGFTDLVFEHQGRYWVLDYKSNALGGADVAYHQQALAAGMAEHRYDIQGALYMLALHRLLQSRLGDDYDPASQLGGALFLFLRGIGHAQTRGCYLLEPHPELLEGLDRLLGQES
ncbi:exodeoxyribonuclease V subunit beta [Oxalobacteraceae bacterium A2-2]